MDLFNLNLNNAVIVEYVGEEGGGNQMKKTRARTCAQVDD